MGARHDHGRRDRRIDPNDDVVLSAQDSPPAGYWAGIALVVGGSVLLASKGIFAKLLYARGLHYETVVATRALLAIPGFMLVAHWRPGPAALRHAPTSQLMRAALAGVVCYYVGASLNFYALTLIDASVERALLYSYPAMVVIATWVISRQRPGPIMSLAVIGTFVGIVLVVGLLRPDVPAQNLVGVACVLLCSATIAYYYLASGSLTRSLGSAQFTVVAMTTAGLVLTVHYQIRHGWQTLSLDATSWWLMVALVVFATVLPLYLVAEGLRRVGAERAAVASTSGPPAAALMAAFMLGDSVRVDQWLGILVIVASIALLEIRRGRKRDGSN
ncbi:MAG: DMT family transporter [Gammaproteobacteria bacterium]